MKREIQKTFVASTCHVPLKEIRKIEDEEYPYPIANYNGGAYICIEKIEDLAEPDEEKLENCSPEFVKLVQIARDKGCSHIRLDVDGPEYNDLKKFKW